MIIRGHTEPIRLTQSWRDLPLGDLFDDAEIDGVDVIEERGDLLDLSVRAGESKKADDGSMWTDFIASTASVDRMGDVIDQITWRLAAWRTNPVILYEHKPPVVGAGRATVSQAEKRLEISVRWDASELNPLGMLAAHQHANGFRRAGSVGFIPGKAINRMDLPEGDPRRVATGDRWRAGMVFSHSELLEFSTVAVPANREAVQLAIRANESEDPDERIRRFVSDSLSREVAGLVLTALRSDEQIRRAIEALIWSRPAPRGLPADLDSLFPPRSAP